MFLCRETELRKLNRRYAGEQLECIIIYGRRRVGKTALINEFSQKKPTIFFPALKTSAQGNLEALSKAIYCFEHPDAVSAPVYPSFDAAFAEITRIARSQRLVFAIDELPYLVKSDPSITSRLQHLLDHEWSDTKLFLILSWFLNKTYMGRSIRATSDDTQAASLMGVSVKRTYGIAMGIAMATAAVAGLCIALKWTYYPSSGGGYLLTAFGVVVIGGMGSIPGTLIAGLILGLAQVIGGANYGQLIAYVLMVLFLAVRPQGLFSK